MKKIKSMIIIILLIYITIEILTSSSLVLNSAKFSLQIWETNIFPSLFPFFVLSELLINYGFVELLSELFKPIMNKLFKTNGESAFIFIMSLLSGFPSNSKYTKELYLNGKINEYEATKILTFTHFSNPLFILGTIGGTFLNNKRAGFLILISHYIGNIIVGIIFKNLYPTKLSNNFSLKKAINDMTNKQINNKLSFGEVLSNAIKSSLQTLFLILGTISTFLVITTIINSNLNINSLNQSIVNGFFEMTQGLKSVSLLNIPLKYKCVLSTMIISFGGLSVHMQVVSIISGTKIKYLPYFTARLIHASISSLIVYFLI